MLSRRDTDPISQRPPEWLAAVVAVGMVGLMMWLRLVLVSAYMLPIGYGVPLVILAWFRRRRVLCAAAIGFAAIALCKLGLVLPSKTASPEDPHFLPEIGSIVLVLVDLFLVTSISYLWITTVDRVETRNAQLEAVNAELVAGEEEITRQNEEMQSQAEELERQSEELRFSNDELADRERTLNALLSLSRALATELSRNDALSRICETLGSLVEGPSVASAVLEQQRDKMVVRCHHGFGSAGIAADELPIASSFASLVIARDRTGYLTDIALRPDLVFPQPREGERIVSVLATPLRVRGKAVGSLEVYGREPMNWTDQQISLVESLAAQTSVSLEAAELFETVSRERLRFETVLGTVPFGIGVANADCSDIRMNPAGAAILGVLPDVNVANDLARHAWQVFQQGRLLSALEVPLARACRDGAELLAQEFEVLVRGGGRLTLLVNARPICGSDGKITGAVSAFVDITPQKELQRELDLRRREAEEASVRKTRFLAAVSHDIRTPANAISLLAELVRRTAANPAQLEEVPQLAAELHASAMSLVRLLSDVLDIARFDSGRIELEESEFSINEVLIEETRQMQPLARERGLELNFVALPQAIWLRTDRIKLGRILGNLIGNAIKFTDAGTVSVEAEQMDGQGVQIRVSDSGVGIAKEHLDHIFDEFFQLRNPERDRNKGTGLGLTICKRLVDAMGGKIDVSSSPGAGSCFTVILPPTAILPTRN